MKKAMFVLLLCGIAYSQDEADLNYLSEQPKPFFLKIGGGIGAAYGGWYGIGTEVGFGIISATAGLGSIYANTFAGTLDGTKPGAELGWQLALKIYFTGVDSKFRPSLAVHFGRVYPYAIQNDTNLVKGLYYGFTPSIIFEHQLTKKRRVGLTYGLGPVIHKAIPEDVKEVIKIITGKELIINLSLSFGVNFYFF